MDKRKTHRLWKKPFYCMSKEEKHLNDIFCMKGDAMIRNGGTSHAKHHHRRHHGRCDDATTNIGNATVQRKMTDTVPYLAETQAVDTVKLVGFLIRDYRLAALTLGIFVRRLYALWWAAFLFTCGRTNHRWSTWACFFTRYNSQRTASSA